VSPLFLFVGIIIFFHFSEFFLGEMCGYIAKILYLCKRFRFPVSGNFLEPKKKKVIQNG